MNRIVNIYPNFEILSQTAAEMFVNFANEAIRERGQFTVALAGGSTPKSLYQLLATERINDKLDWKKTFFFFGDERNVSPGNAESNFKMANEILFEPLMFPAGNIFRWETELKNAEIIAENYEETIKDFFVLAANEFPRFDLILLGMGDDGHTASLFPFTDALNQTEKIAAANYVEKLQTSRLTLTFPVINNAANIIFLVSGANKAEILCEVLEGEFQPEKFPSQKVNPGNGDIYWLIEANASQKLSKF